jgi:plastocyanin
MYGHIQQGGGFTRREQETYSSRLVGMFFAGLVTVCVLAISAAVIVSIVVGRPAGAQMMSAMPGATAVPAPLAARGGEVQSVVHISIGGSIAMGPDGKLHDAFSATNYAVHVGQPIRLVIDNADSAPHTITAPGAGVNLVVMQGVHTYTLVVYKAGRFSWFCALPCDTDAKGWAMSKPGFMSGYITAT